MNKIMHCQLCESMSLPGDGGGVPEPGGHPDDVPQAGHLPELGLLLHLLLLQTCTEEL